MSRRHERVLVIEDDAMLGRYLAQVLSREGYQVRVAADGTQALELARRFSPELVILDLALPDMPGQVVCRRLRSGLASPILVLSGYQDEEIKVQALDAGADDYLTKPFSLGELLARLGALLRRQQRAEGRPAVVGAGEITIDLRARRVQFAGHPVPLTRMEFDILACLASQPGEIVPAEQIIETIWGVRNEGMHPTLRVHVSHLREKLGNRNLIETVSKVGYRLAISPSPSQ